MKKFLLLLSIPILVFSCKKDDEPGKQSEKNCTEELRVTSVSVVDKANAPYSLDSLKVYITVNDKPKNISLITNFKSEEFKNCQKIGVYPIFNDGIYAIVKGVKLTEIPKDYLTTVSIECYKDDKIISKTSALALHDGCHAYTTPNLKIVIE